MRLDGLLRLQIKDGGRNDTMISIEPFAQKHIEDAAALFISAYRRQRAETDCLPSQYAELETVTGLLGSMLDRHPGVVALSGARLVGYLTGFANIPNFKGISPGVYVPEWAHGSAESAPEAYQSMYETLARAWIGNGCFTHSLTFFVSDSKLRDLLYWNGFGLLVVDALRALGQGDPNDRGELNPGLVVRKANGGDLEDLARLDNELETYLSRSPTFLYRNPGRDADFSAEFLGDDMISVVAEKDGRVLACIRGRDVHDNACAIVRDPSLMGIDFAWTDPSARGSGIGTRILGRILEWGRSNQKKGCAVDFESANALGRAFWLRHFEAICYSAIRHVDPKVGAG
jgi:GNAT superfamily N-acetyltransferase